MKTNSKQVNSPLPPDCTLLELFQGKLLVSRSHATFCRIPADLVKAMEAVLDGHACLDGLPQPLLGELDRHGFFGEPRPSEPDPPTVQFQITNECNLKCTYCCTNSGKRRSQELGYDDLLRIASDVREALGEGGKVSLLGGEPLLVPWALDMAEHMVDLGLDLTLFTNGLLFNDEALARHAAKLNRDGMEIRVSLGGPTAEICDAISLTPRFETVLNGLANLKRFECTAIADLMIIPQNFESVAKHLPALRNRLPSGTRLVFGILYLSGRELGEHIFESPSALESALDRITFEAGESVASPQKGPLAFHRDGCGCALGHHLHLRSDGSLFNCFKMEEKVGDLRSDGFLETMERVRANPYCAFQLPTCADCVLNTLCGGGCRSENILYTGDGSVPVCDTWRVRVISELLAEERISAVDWPLGHLFAEARARGIETPPGLPPLMTSRHLIDT